MTTENRKEKILFVDDDQRVLNGFRRQLHASPWDADTAVGPAEGLEKVRTGGPYAVIVSDLRMPDMDGIQFLSRVGRMAPDTVRMMLTGYADLQNAMKAVNEGNVFRFLTKPCKIDQLNQMLEAGVRQYRLVTAEKELLDKTLKGSIEVLTDLLNMTNPEAFGRSARIRRHVMQMAACLPADIMDDDFNADAWQLETAAMLSHIGCVLLPSDAFERVYANTGLTEKEKEVFVTHSRIASDLLARVPRLDEIARIISYQNKNYDGSGFPVDEVAAGDIPPASRMLKAALDFDMLQAKGMSSEDALDRMKERTTWYDPVALTALETAITGAAAADACGWREMAVSELEPGMVLAADILSDNRLMISAGHTLSNAYITRLEYLLKAGMIREPVLIFFEK